MLPSLSGLMSAAIPLTKCPTCGYEMDAATCLADESARPTEGDLSVCLCCGELLAYTASLGVRILDLNDMLRIPPETQAELLRHQTVIRRERLIKR